MTTTGIVEALPPGRAHFFEALRAECIALVGNLVRTQGTHADYLAARDRLFMGAAWKRSQLSARREAMTYLDGSIETLHTVRAIVWKHRVAGKWITAPLPEGADYATVQESAHVWASSDKPWFQGPASAPEAK